MALLSFFIFYTFLCKPILGRDIVHIVAKTTDVTIGQNSNIPDDQVYNALAALNKQFAGYGLTDSRAVNTGIQFYLAPVGPDNNGIIRYNDALSYSKKQYPPVHYKPILNENTGGSELLWVKSTLKTSKFNEFNPVFNI